MVIPYPPKEVCTASSPEEDVYALLDALANERKKEVEVVPIESPAAHSTLPLLSSPSPLSGKSLYAIAVSCTPTDMLQHRFFSFTSPSSSGLPFHCRLPSHNSPTSIHPIYARAQGAVEVGYANLGVSGKVAWPPASRSATRPPSRREGGNASPSLPQRASGEGLGVTHLDKGKSKPFMIVELSDQALLSLEKIHHERKNGGTNGEKEGKEAEEWEAIREVDMDRKGPVLPTLQTSLEEKLDALGDHTVEQKEILGRFSFPPHASLSRVSPLSWHRKERRKKRSRIHRKCESLCWSEHLAHSPLSFLSSTSPSSTSLLVSPLLPTSSTSWNSHVPGSDSVLISSSIPEKDRRVIGSASSRTGRVRGGGPSPEEASDQSGEGNVEEAMQGLPWTRHAASCDGVEQDDIAGALPGRIDRLSSHPSPHPRLLPSITRPSVSVEREETTATAPQNTSPYRRKLPVRRTSPAPYYTSTNLSYSAALRGGIDESEKGHDWNSAAVAQEESHTLLPAHHQEDKLEKKTSHSKGISLEPHPPLPVHAFQLKVMESTIDSSKEEGEDGDTTLTSTSSSSPTSSNRSSPHRAILAVRTGSFFTKGGTVSSSLSHSPSSFTPDHMGRAGAVHTSYEGTFSAGAPSMDSEFSAPPALSEVSHGGKDEKWECVMGEDSPYRRTKYSNAEYKGGVGMGRDGVEQSGSPVAVISDRKKQRLFSRVSLFSSSLVKEENEFLEGAAGRKKDEKNEGEKVPTHSTSEVVAILWTEGEEEEEEEEENNSEENCLPLSRVHSMSRRDKRSASPLSSMDKEEGATGGGRWRAHPPPFIHVSLMEKRFTYPAVKETPLSPFLVNHPSHPSTPLESETVRGEGENTSHTSSGGGGKSILLTPRKLATRRYSQGDSFSTPLHCSGRKNGKAHEEHVSILEPARLLEKTMAKMKKREEREQCSIADTRKVSLRNEEEGEDDLEEDNNYLSTSSSNSSRRPMLFSPGNTSLTSSHQSTKEAHTRTPFPTFRRVSPVLNKLTVSNNFLSSRPTGISFRRGRKVEIANNGPHFFSSVSLNSSGIPFFSPGRSASRRTSLNATSSTSVAGLDGGGKRLSSTRSASALHRDWRGITYLPAEETLEEDQDNEAP